MRLNVEQEDVAGFLNHVKFCVTICSPYLTPEQEHQLIVGPHKEDQALFDRGNDVMRALLRFMAEKGIYAFPKPDPGDASELMLGD